MILYTSSTSTERVLAVMMTPMMMPSMVRKVRTLLLKTFWTACLKVSFIMPASPPLRLSALPS